jgi:Arc/MetJ-type ribon-helix-helix transcriptional regulator
MTIHLSQDLETSIRSLVRDGRFASFDDAMAEAVRLLLQQQALAKKPPTSAEFDQLLLGLGLMSELPDTAADHDDPDDRLITIHGEPLSETVIRERR